MLNINHQKDRSIVVFPEDLIDLNIMRLEGIPSCIPTNELLLLTDLHQFRCTFFIISNIDS